MSEKLFIFLFVISCFLFIWFHYQREVTVWYCKNKGVVTYYNTINPQGYVDVSMLGECFQKTTTAEIYYQTKTNVIKSN